MCGQLKEIYMVVSIFLFVVVSLVDKVVSIIYGFEWFYSFYMVI